MLVYHDQRSPRPTAFRVPAHCHGANLERRQCDTGDLIAHSRPLMKDGVVGIQVPPEGTEWLQLPDDWRVTFAGDDAAFVPAHYLRAHRDRPQLLSVRDGKGRAWEAPAVLSPDLKNRDGDVILSMSWGRDKNGMVARIPSTQQEQMIAAARGYRAEMLAQRLAQLPADTAAQWFLTLVQTVYHLHPDMILTWGWMDDILVGAYLMAAAGFVKPAGT